MKTDVLVIGAGPAGMMAAHTAALYGARVLLLERNDHPGRKLLITGKGRCNVTNDCGETEFLQNIPTNPKFLYSAIYGFTTRDTKNWFEQLGVALKTERGNRVFPVSDRASDIAGAMVRACREAGVRFEVGRVAELLREDRRITGIRCEDGREFSARGVILATGGRSYPMTGSTGDGYNLAESVGHMVTPVRPSLVPLTSDDETCADLQGLSLRNVELSLVEETAGKKPRVLYRELGEMLFTHYGMSGPLVLSASAHIRDWSAGRYLVRIDLKPGLDEKQLDNRILRDFTEFANRDFANSLEKLLPRKLIPIVVQRSGVPPLQKVNAITREQRRALITALKRLTISVNGFRPIDEAIVTAGGVKVSEVDPKTMASKLLPGLYFAGEVLDVDGYTGGFNLQIAFSTGYAAGMAAAMNINDGKEAEQ